MTQLALCFLVSLFLFILALHLIKAGAQTLTAWFAPQGQDITPASAAGSGWLLSCVVLSGSPVAAIALGLLDSGVLDKLQSFSMIIGSRIGASFAVLVVGLAYDLRARQTGGGLYVGTLALITTVTIYVPAFFLGYFFLEQGWFDGVDFGLPPPVASALELVLSPIVTYICDTLPEWSLVLLGVACLVAAFKIFDGFLPVVDPTGGKISHMATTIYRPWITFVFGMIVTCITLSVSVSLTLLVPLTSRGIVRRENLVPYILGANITTFVDTLLASSLLENPSGFTAVFCAVFAVTLISVPVVFLGYRPYERLVDGLTRAVTSTHTRLILFVSLLFSIALCLIWY